tara:strand:+ start:849 stop:1334 length:486 start_codon:yes stop_codon:yes gene_type:complete
MGLPVHRLEWSVNASGVADIDLISKALIWLIGDEKFIEIEKTQSFHGSSMYIIRANVDKKSSARKSFPRIGSKSIEQLRNSLNDRIDDENWLHLRLDLDELVCGRIVLVESRDKVEFVKGRIKLEIYPNEIKEDVARRLFDGAEEIAEKLGFPPLSDVNDE